MGRRGADAVLRLGLDCDRAAIVDHLVEPVVMALDPLIIRERLARLSKRDRKRKLFGSASHGYVLNPPLGADGIERFETKHGIALPDDYKLFITEIGNGGAGPAYGLFPFGQHDDNIGLCSWEGGDLVGDIGQPFPHAEAWNVAADFWANEPDPPNGISEDDEDKLWEEWDKVLAAEYWKPGIINGAIPICHLGCALRQWLVVHGDQRGLVWDDMRADNGGLAPVHNASGQQMTFEEWYLAWLDEAERDRNTQAVDSASYRERVPRSRRELFTLLLLIVAGVFLGLLLAIYRAFR